MTLSAQRHPAYAECLCDFTRTLARQSFASLGERPCGHTPPLCPFEQRSMQFVLRVHARPEFASLGERKCSHSRQSTTSTIVDEEEAPWRLSHCRPVSVRIARGRIIAGKKIVETSFCHVVPTFILRSGGGWSRTNDLDFHRHALRHVSFKPRSVH